jgi:hypothetical protein
VHAVVAGAPGACTSHSAVDAPLRGLLRQTPYLIRQSRAWMQLPPPQAPLPPPLPPPPQDLFRVAEIQTGPRSRALPLSTDSAPSQSPPCPLLATPFPPRQRTIRRSVHDSLCLRGHHSRTPYNPYVYNVHNGDDIMASAEAGDLPSAARKSSESAILPSKLPSQASGPALANGPLHTTVWMPLADTRLTPT